MSKIGEWEVALKQPKAGVKLANIVGPMWRYSWSYNVVGVANLFNSRYSTMCDNV